MGARLLVMAACGALVACRAFSPDVGPLREDDAGETCSSSGDGGGAYANGQPDEDDASACEPPAEDASPEAAPAADAPYAGRLVY